MHAFTLADYTGGGTTVPVVGGIVTPSATGNYYVKAAANNDTHRLGVIVKIELAASGTARGYCVVKWLDAIRVVQVPTDDVSTTALLQSAIVDGTDGNDGNYDAAATTGPLVVIAETAGTGTTGTLDCLVFGS
jgi:hypothetical protein